MCREAVSIQSRYYQFGTELGLPLREMETIQKTFQLDIAQAFSTVLTRWLRHSYDVKKYGPPTWRRLVEAVDSPAGGNNHALAKKIAEHHPVKGSQNDHAQVTKNHSSTPEETTTSIGENSHVMVEAIAEHHHNKGT